MRRVRFDCYEVDLDAGEIYRRGTRVRLPDQPFRLLATLLEHRGELVTREDLRRRLWADDVFVDFESALNTDVAKVREALGDSAAAPRFIETLPKRGYRFIASVTEGIREEAPPPARRTRLLVLPFVAWSVNAGQEYLGDAVTDDVITELAALAPHRLAVIARTTAMRYRGTVKDVAEIGRELGVDYLVEGAIRGTEDAIAVNAQLVRASDQAHVWARKYDASRVEAFNVAGSVARAIVDVLAIDWRSDEERGGPASDARSSAHEPIAYSEYLHGRRELDRMNLLREGTEIKSHLENAIARDPGFALAHEALAQFYWLSGYAGLMPPRDAVAVGLLHAVRAIEIDPTRAEARALVAQFRKQLDYDWPEIGRELSGALQLNPASPLARVLYAIGWLMPQGRLEDAIAELYRALDWDPLSFHVHHWLSVVLLAARDWNRGIAEARLLIELEPDAPAGPWLLGVGLRGKGLLDESIEAQQTAVDLSGGAAMFLGWLGLTLASSGRREEALAVLGRLEGMARTTYVPPTSFAWLYLGLGDVDRAFDWLAQAVEARDQFMMLIKSYAFLDPVRRDPRFAGLLRKMNLSA